MAIAEDLAVIHQPDVEDAFQVEQHGIDFIPESERWATPKDIFGMWAGASVQIEYFIYGAILMTFGLTFAQVLFVIVLGNLSYFLLGLCSLQGPNTGTAVFAITPGDEIAIMPIATLKITTPDTLLFIQSSP